MYTYEVRYKVEGDWHVKSIYVEAKDSSTAKNVALGEIGGMAGYANKTITILTVKKV